MWKLEKNKEFPDQFPATDKTKSILAQILSKEIRGFKNRDLSESVRENIT